MHLYETFAVNNRRKVHANRWQVLFAVNNHRKIQVKYMQGNVYFPFCGK